MKGFVDSHLHMADPEFGTGYEGMEECPLLLSCTAKQDEWEIQRMLSANDDRIYPFYGTHPWYVDCFDPVTLRTIIENNPNSGIGEIGLDSIRGDVHEQMSIFEEQMSIAEEYDRPVSIHMVRTEKETLDIIGKYESTKIMIHSFSSAGYVKHFTEIGCYISISPRSINRSDEKNGTLVKSIPMDRLLIETDYPGFKTNVSDFVEKLALLLSIDTDELIDITSNNARRLIQ